MTAKLRAAVLTARRATQHIRLFEPHDAYECLCILALPPSLAPSPPYAGRYTVASRFWCHSCECGYIVRGLRTVCCLAAPTSWATRNEMRGLIHSSLVKQSYPAALQVAAQAGSYGFASPLTLMCRLMGVLLARCSQSLPGCPSSSHVSLKKDQSRPRRCPKYFFLSQSRD